MASESTRALRSVARTVRGDEVPRALLGARYLTTIPSQAIFGSRLAAIIRATEKRGSQRRRK